MALHIPHAHTKPGRGVRRPPADATALVVPASPGSLSTALQADRERADKDRGHLRSDSTKASYDRAWRAFAAWCKSRGLVADQVEDENLAAYLSWLSEERPTPPKQRRHGTRRPSSGREGMSWSTIAQAYSAIAMVYRRLRRPGWEGPRACPPRVWEQYEALRNKLGVAPKMQKTPLLLDDLEKMVNALPGTDLPTLRDRALLLTDYFLAARSAEAIDLDIEDIEKAPRADGSLNVVIRKSKQDQAGKGFTKGLVLAQKNKKLCPVRALQAWIKESDIRFGPIFRPFGPRGELLDQHMSRRHVTGIVKRVARAAGFDESFVAQIASHSLRAGYITQAALNGSSLEEIAAHTGHKDLNTLRGYIRRAEAVGASNPTRRMI